MGISFPVLCSSCPARCGGGALRGWPGCLGRGASGRAELMSWDAQAPPLLSHELLLSLVLAVKVPSSATQPPETAAAPILSFRRSRWPDGEANGLGGPGVLGRWGDWGLDLCPSSPLPLPPLPPPPCRGPGRGGSPFFSPPGSLPQEGPLPQLLQPQLPAQRVQGPGLLSLATVPPTLHSPAQPQPSMTPVSAPLSGVPTLPSPWPGTPPPPRPMPPGLSLGVDRPPLIPEQDYQRLGGW